jgi:hypothetical protein
VPWRGCVQQEGSRRPGRCEWPAGTVYSRVDDQRIARTGMWLCPGVAV